MNGIAMVLMGISLMSASAGSAFTTGISTKDVDVRVAGDYLNVSADIVLDSLDLGSNRQILITPLIKGADSEEQLSLPSVLVSGRNMHISYERGVLRQFPMIKDADISQEVRRDNGKAQTISYATRVPLAEWMRRKNTNMVFLYDACGCGASAGEPVSEEYIIFTNPVKEMRAATITPAITELPIEIHEGKARVQFEVNKTDLHVEPYRCKNGQLIDNTLQIIMIDDSVNYALTDPNVELSGIAICGYASPESPYLHNEQLATERSRALAEYLADRYNLPHDKVSYSAVAENWGEFRKQVERSDELTEQQRTALLELIDAPAITPEDYDSKEKTLKTDPAFRQLYKTRILPEWFPKLRATTFAIQTQLKPMPDTELAKVLETTPEKMSLNQMYRVAQLYPEGSDEYNHVIETALMYYPSDRTALVNAATIAVTKGEYDRARDLLQRAGDSPEVFNLLGIIATAEERYDDAIHYFEQAGDIPQAKLNLQLLK